MQLSARRVQILNYVIKESKGVPTQQLSRRLSISQRALNYDLEQINSWLDYHSWGKIITDNCVVRLESSFQNEILQNVSQEENYIYSIEERLALEFLHIALSTQPVTTHIFSDLFDVSRNTLFADIKELKEDLEKHKILLKSAGVNGYELHGNEETIRLFIQKKLIGLETSLPRQIVEELIENSLREITGRDDCYYKLGRQLVAEFEKKMSTYLVQSEAQQIVSIMLAAFIRSKQGFVYRLSDQEKDALEETEEYQTLLKMRQSYFDAQLEFIDDEIYYITIILLGSQNFDTITKEVESEYIRGFVKDLIDNFQRVACVRFSDEEYLRNRLYLHIRPLYYRLKYGVNIKNSLFSQIMSMYLDNFFYTKKAIHLSGGEIADLITDEEIAFICIYMTSSLGAGKNQEQIGYHKRILIVCGEGVASAVLLREQLKDFLGYAFEFDIVPAGKVSGEMLDSYVLIISTVRLDIAEPYKEKIIYTGPILSSEDRRNILLVVNDMEAFSVDSFELNRTMDIIRQHATINDEQQLYLALMKNQLHAYGRNQHTKALTAKEILKTGGSVESSYPVSLDYVLSQNVNRILDDSGKEEQAMLQMLAHINDGKGVYSFADGFILEYFQGITNEVRVAVTLFEDRHLVYQGEEYKGVVTISCTDNESHYPLLSVLYMYFENEEKVKGLLEIDGNSQDKLEHIITNLK